MDTPSAEGTEHTMSRNPSAQVVLERNSTSILSADRHQSKLEPSSIVEETYARFFENKRYDDKNQEAFSVLEDAEHSSEFSLYQTHEVGLTQSYLDMNHGIGRIPIEAEYDGKHSEFVTNYLKSKYLREIGAPIEEDDRESELARSLNKMVSSQSGGILAVRSPREPDKVIESARRLELTAFLAKKLSSSASGPNLTRKQTESEHPCIHKPQGEMRLNQPSPISDISIKDRKADTTSNINLDCELAESKLDLHQPQQGVTKSKYQVSVTNTPQSHSNKKASQRYASSVLSGSAPVEEFTIREINYLDEETNMTQRNFALDGIKTSRGPSPKKPRLGERLQTSERNQKDSIGGEVTGHEWREKKPGQDKYKHIFPSSSHKDQASILAISNKDLSSVNPPRIQINLLDLSSSSGKRGTHTLQQKRDQNPRVDLQKKNHSRSESENLYTPHFEFVQPNLHHKREDTLKHQHRNTEHNKVGISMHSGLQTAIQAEGISELLRKQDMVIELLLKGHASQQQHPSGPLQAPDSSIVAQLQTENEHLKARVLQLERERAEDKQDMLRMEYRLNTLEMLVLPPITKHQGNALGVPINTIMPMETNAKLPTSFQSVLDGMKTSSVRESLQHKIQSPKGNLAGVISSKNMSRCGTNASMMQNSDKLLGNSMLDLSLSRFGLIDDLQSPVIAMYEPPLPKQPQAPTKMSLGTAMFKKKASLPAKQSPNTPGPNIRMQDLFKDRGMDHSSSREPQQHSIQQEQVGSRRQPARQHTPTGSQTDGSEKPSKKMLSPAAVQRLVGQFTSSFSQKPERMLANAKSSSFSGASRAKLV